MARTGLCLQYEVTALHSLGQGPWGLHRRAQGLSLPLQLQVSAKHIGTHFKMVVCAFLTIVNHWWEFWLCWLLGFYTSLFLCFIQLYTSFYVSFNSLSLQYSLLNLLSKESQGKTLCWGWWSVWEWLKTCLGTDDFTEQNAVRILYNVYHVLNKNNKWRKTENGVWLLLWLQHYTNNEQIIFCREKCV